MKTVYDVETDDALRRATEAVSAALPEVAARPPMRNIPMPSGGTAAAAHRTATRRRPVGGAPRQGAAFQGHRRACRG